LVLVLPFCCCRRCVDASILLPLLSVFAAMSACVPLLLLLLVLLPV
jgi:hypothetical protein